MDEVEVAEDLARARLLAASSLEELASATAEAHGKRSRLAAITAKLRDLPPEDRRTVGRALQDARARLEQLGAERYEHLLAEGSRRRATLERLDLTEAAGLFAVAAGPLAETVAQPAPRGHLHLVTQVREELEDIFVSMGFDVAEGPEAEDDWHNFEALNMPPHHPARGMFDTFYLKGAGESAGSQWPSCAARLRCCARIPRRYRSA